jgi:hypothetical protein
MQIFPADVSVWVCLLAYLFSGENVSHSIMRNSVFKAAVSHHTCRFLFLTEDPMKPKAATWNSVWFKGNITMDSSQEGKDPLSHSSCAPSCAQKAPCKGNMSQIMVGKREQELQTCIIHNQDPSWHRGWNGRARAHLSDGPGEQEFLNEVLLIQGPQMTLGLAESIHLEPVDAWARLPLLDTPVYRTIKEDLGSKRMRCPHMCLSCSLTGPQIFTPLHYWLQV